MVQSQEKAFHVLVVEDNAQDKELMKLLFQECQYPYQLHFAGDGAEAADFIFKRGAFKETPLPDLILLDLNLPGKNGPELLKELKAHSDLCQIPIVMLSTSSSEHEIKQMYCLGTSAFITKPVDFESYRALMNKLVDFWFGCITLPTRVGLPFEI